MGVESAKLPGRDFWLNRLLPDLDRKDPEKRTFYLGWFYNEIQIGHCNINKINYGQDVLLSSS